MPRVVRLPRAREDLIAIWSYIALNNPMAADRTLDRLEDKLGLLARNPHLGVARPEIGADMRLFPVGKYLILYRPLEDGVEIVRVIHGARRPGSIAL